MNGNGKPDNTPGSSIPGAAWSRAKTLPAELMKGRLSRWVPLLRVIDRFDSELTDQTDTQLRKRSLALQYRAKSGELMANMLPEGYALVREAARRKLDMRHFDVQMLGGIALFYGCIAEMETGEGKTLTATLPLYLHSLAGRGSHLATVNDYLARRDAEWMEPVYNLLGLSVGIIESQMSQPDRRKSYACDITYGTAKEFGFDFLRDRLLLRRLRDEPKELVPRDPRRQAASHEEPVQRAAHSCLVDEADSILIDEARTPLIISAIPGAAEQRAVACFRWAAEIAPTFIEDEHYEHDHEKKTVELTAAGRRYVRELDKPVELESVGLVDIYEYIEQSVKVDREFHLDAHYVVRDDEIVIVDEFTGRLAEGRKWRAGIHQAIEAKERVEVTVPTGQAARITVQDLFLRYKHLAGMTGTAASSARELRKIYKCPFVRVPTNRPVRRKRLGTRIYGTTEEKWLAIVDDIRNLHEMGRPVLIGTRSIDKSEALSKHLVDAGIEHSVLNANQIAKEAEIVARAGEPAKVTVATNMAGRGTDIKLGDGVPELGGLHVICTELHDSARIDRQLMGRCGRQGDPGTAQQFVALDDDILHAAYGPKKSRRFKAVGEGDARSYQRFSRRFRRAQSRVERRHFRSRKVLLHHEKQRKKMQIEMGQDPYLDTADT